MDRLADNHQVKLVKVDDHHDGQRLDNFLIRKIKGAPKSLAYKLIRTGQVRVNAKRAKAHTKLMLGDEVRIPPVSLKDANSAKPSQNVLNMLAQRIVYEDEDLLVLNKPSGMAVHGGSGVKLGVIENLRQLRPKAPFLELVHRLDRATSGCLVVAKSRKKLLELHDRLRNGSLDKVYHTLLVGEWKGPKKVELPLTKNQLKSGERLVKVDPDGKPSVTKMKTLKSFSCATLVEAKPVTGRTHQIRVHAAYMGHAVAMDEKYGHRQDNKLMRKLGISRLFLHAYQISIPTRQDKTLTVVCPLDDNLQQILQKL